MYTCTTTYCVDRHKGIQQILYCKLERVARAKSLLTPRKKNIFYCFGIWINGGHQNLRAVKSFTDAVDVDASTLADQVLGFQWLSNVTTCGLQQE